MVNINTGYTKEAGTDIIRLTDEINSIINEIFRLIDTVPWEGSGVATFKSKAKLDKGNYLKFTNDMKEYGKFLVEYASDMERVVSRVNR